MFKVARSWHPDVVKFALENGAEINKADLYGRTPLHLAAAVDYGDMVQYLIENGAELGRETFDEKQTAMHYAAKNNACTSLKVSTVSNFRGLSHNIYIFICLTFLPWQNKGIYFL